MADPTGWRKARIEKLLYELRYEIERGLIEGEIEEKMTFQFLFPESRTKPGMMILGRFIVTPTTRYAELLGDMDGKTHWGEKK